MSQEYTNGWIGLTKSKWTEMNNTISNQLPVFCRVSSGLGLCAEETLRANGIHPDFVPIVFKSNYSTIGKLLLEIEQVVPITYVDIPD